MPRKPRSDDVKLAVGLRLAAVREALGLDQGEVAREVGATRTAVSNWERGDRLADPLAMVRLCDRHGVTMDWIYRNQLGAVAMDLAEKVRAEHAKLLAGRDRDGPPSASRKTA